MMTWRRPSRKIEANFTIYRVEGVNSNAGLSKLGVEIKWKGSKRYLRRSQKRYCTKVGALKDGGFVEYNEVFSSVCRFQESNKDGGFHPWEVNFTLFNSLNEGTSNKTSPIATASLNLSDFASVNKEKDLDLRIPLSVCGGISEFSPSLCLSLRFLELRAAQEYTETVQRSVASSPLSARFSETLSPAKDEVSAIKAGLRKVKILTSYVSIRRAKKKFREEEGSDGKISDSSDNAEYNYPFDTDSLDELHEEESEEGKEIVISGRKSNSNGPLAYSSFARTLYYSAASQGADDDDLVYYSNRRSDNEACNGQDLSSSPVDQAIWPSSRRSIILPWRKRKLGLRSPQNKGEPLLKKDCREEGGDDIDFDRRQFSSSDESSFGWHNEDSTRTRSSFLEFGDDGFVIGSWESKEIISRDGHMKLQTQVFFASIDQRSERAAGESACTALVAVVADWFQSNPGQMPIKSQFDRLIREGSAEWRNLCDNEAYKEQFPDKHFDLETVLEAKIRPLYVVPQKSFIGFFHPEGLEETEGFSFLKDAMSFDSIWEEISRYGSDSANGDSMVYIISWNDHFFVLKVEQDAYYIIDTLGERLYEGCSQAYILKFDRDTTIQDISKENQSSDKKSKLENPKPGNPKEETKEGAEIVATNELVKSEEEREEPVFCGGRESCKEYIKSFLAAIPIRELQVDLKKGLMASTPLHHRLQIEFHYTKYLDPVFQFPSLEGTDDAGGVPAWEVAL